MILLKILIILFKVLVIVKGYDGHLNSDNISNEITENSDEILKNYFDVLNDELYIFNQQSASIAWNFSIDSKNEELGTQSAKLSEMALSWNLAKCEEIKHFKENLNDQQKRMFYLLCRGTKFTQYQASHLWSELSKMENIFVNTKICVPKDFDACENSDNLWNFTFLKQPDNSMKQLLFNGVNYFASQSFQKFNDLKCFSGESTQQKVLARDFTMLSDNPQRCQDNKDKILYWMWETWRLAVGPELREIYPKAISLMNLGAFNNDYQDIGNVWREQVELDSVKEVSRKLLDQIFPFYNMLHTFVRYILKQKYPNIDITSDNLLPAHISGTISWESLFHEEVAPFIFQQEFNFDLEKSMRGKNWSPIDLIKRSEDFYSSLGLYPMPEKFWTKSFISDSDTANGTNCHGTAANMFDKNDFRMITCASKNFYDFYVIIHEMGHIQYYMQSDQQPTVFQDGNIVVQESLGDAMYLALMTPVHLNRLRLIPDENIFHTKISENFHLYILMKLAFTKIPLVPFQYLFDVFRWDLFSGKVSFSDANDYYWYLTEKLQKLKPPNRKLDRHNLFDIGAYFHLADNTPYNPYFLASFVQAQIFKAMCEITVFGRINVAQELPMDLHKCDIYGSKKAGKLLRMALQEGNSIPLKDILKLLTGQEEISAEPLLEFYRPLINWLHEFFRKNNIEY